MVPMPWLTSFVSETCAEVVTLYSRAYLVTSWWPGVRETQECIQDNMLKGTSPTPTPHKFYVLELFCCESTNGFI